MFTSYSIRNRKQKGEKFSIRCGLRIRSVKRVSPKENFCFVLREQQFSLGITLVFSNGIKGKMYRMSSYIGQF